MINANYQLVWNFPKLARFGETNQRYKNVMLKVRIVTKLNSTIEINIIELFYKTMFSAIGQTLIFTKFETFSPILDTPCFLPFWNEVLKKGLTKILILNSSVPNWIKYQFPAYLMKIFIIFRS